MSRLVIAAQPAPVGALAVARQGQEPDGFKERVAKYVPIEIVGAYTFLLNAISAAKSDRESWLIVAAFVVCLTATPLYFLKAFTGDPAIKRLHAIIATIAFPIWAYSITPAIFGVDPVPALAAILLVGFSLFAGLLRAES